ncbi:hypothetical protein ACKN8S_13440 (plasmid) [Limosilactobacillus reuteri]|uniref:hypothetical protein n=1 Tax=Limosilactobacillus reuteri TaxID=1598 RepID=UPI0039BF6E24
MNKKNLFALNLKLMRQHEQYSYRDIQDKTDGLVSANRVEEIERLKVQPTTQEFNALAELFHFSPSLFTKGKGDEK